MLVADHIHAMLAYWDKNQICRFANKAYMEWFGMTREDMVDKITMKELLGPLYELNLPYITEVLKGKEQQFERSIRTPSGDVKDSIANYHPHILNGEVKGFFVHVADITFQKEREREIRRIDEILDKTNEVARIGTWEVDLIKNRVTWSRITREIHEVGPDYEPELDTAINFFKQGRSRDIIRTAIANAISEGTTYDVEVELVTGKGNVIWARSIGQAEFEDGVCKRLYGFFQDIDEVKRSREHIKTLNEELRSLFDAAYVSIIGTDKNGLITHFNKGAEILLQYTAKEMIGIATPALIHVKEEVEKRGEELSDIYGKTIEGFDVFVEQVKHDEHDAHEWTYIRKDGSTFPVQLVITAIKDMDGTIKGFLGIATDISVLKKAEEETISLLDITKDQNERLKNFAHIVSHNLRSHSGNIDMLLDLYIEETPEVRDNEFVTLLKTSVNNLKETIANLNEVVLMNTSVADKAISINLSDAIDNAVNSVSQIAKDAEITISNEVAKNITILGLPAYIDSILLNFVTNGIKYRSLNRLAKIVFKAVQTPQYIILDIADNGVGIDMDRNRSKLFGMYKTFHGNEDARGIGLFITKNQVESMGGRIEVESELNKGTTFKVYLKYQEK
ncbi:MAG: PAS domain S-box protein [Flavipsychrobacter sp.]|nr:PAS domain S-box protein [Flavipsychrobacter sp.]